MAGWFRIVTTKNGGFKFDLVAGNRKVIATSQTYKNLDACKVGIESLRKNCGVPIEDQTGEGFEKLPHPKYEVYRDKAGGYRFRLKARNGEIVVTGESYKNKDGCLRGIASIARNAPEAEILEA